MIAKLHTIKPEAWGLLTGMALLAAFSALVRITGLIPSTMYSYAVQPALALTIFGAAMYVARGHQDRVRHRSEKAFMIGSVLAVWFVVYFLSGLVTTYVNNSLVSSPKSIILNLWSFGVVAFCIEFARHRLMLVIGRRNVVWFGVIVAVVFGLQQLNFGLIPATHGLEGFIELAVSDIIPAIVGSFLLTYLAIAGGLPSMLVYRLGIVAATILPPIIPKYDWYLQGISLLFLALCIYIAFDRDRQHRQAPSTHRYRRHQARAYDIMSVLVMIWLVLFTTGFFSYKPAAIASNSMQPVFSRGSIVIVQKVDDPVDVQVGDIVQYKRISEMITHRVVATDAADDGSGDRVFMTKGDNNPSMDPVVNQSQIVGIVRAQIPLIGYPTVWLQGAGGSGIIKP